MEELDSIDTVEKQRHGCVTAWLTFIILINSVVAFLYLFVTDMVAENVPSGDSNMMLMILGVIGLANVLFAYLLLTWKKIGFYGFVISGIITIFINISIGVETQQAVVGLIGIVVLLVILQIKKDGVSAWENLV